MRKISFVMTASAMLALSASFGFAQTQSKEKKNTTKKTDNGVVVTVDPKTHQIRQATPDEIGSMGKARQEKAASAVSLRPDSSASARRGNRELHHATGAVGMALDESYMTSMTVTKDANGKLQYQCVEGKKDGERHDEK